MQELTMKCAGLFTDPNPLNEIPTGSLKQAKNIEIRRLGAAEPRPGFMPEAAPAPGRIEAIIPYGETFTVFRDDAGTQSWEYESGTPITNNDVNGLDVSFGAASTSILLTGPQDLLDTFPYVPGDHVEDPSAAYFGAGPCFQADTRIATVDTSTPGQITLTLGKTTLAAGTAFRAVKWTTATGTISTGATITPPATVLPINGFLVLPSHVQYVAAGAGHPGISFGPYDARTRIVSIDTTAPAPDLVTISKSILSNVSNGNTLRQWSLASEALYGYQSVPPAFAYTVGETSWAEMQKRQYVTLADGLGVLPFEGDVDYDFAGIAQPGQPAIDLFQSPTEGWLGLGDMVAYRVVLARTRGSQLLLSAPSAPSFIQPTPPYLSPLDPDSSFVVLLAGNLPPETELGDVLQVYRTETALSENFPTTPGDEMRLLGSVPITEANLATQTWEYVDRSPDEQLTGASLYTNETQQGILSSNVRPPRMGTIATYSDMMFGGNVSTGHRAELSLIGTPSVGEFNYTDPSRLWPALPVATENFIVVINAGSPLITITGPVDLLTFQLGDYVAGVGQSIWNGGTLYAADTIITNIAITPGQIVLTVSHNALIAATAFDHILAYKIASDMKASASSVSFSTHLQVTTLSSAIRVGMFVSNDGTRPTQPSSTQLDEATQVLTLVATPTPNQFEMTLSRPNLGNIPSNTPIDCYLIYYESPTSIGLADATVVVITAGSPVIDITGVGARYAFAPSQEITDYDKAPGDVGTVWPAGTEILSVAVLSPTHIQITTTDNALANATSFTAWDWIAFNGTRLYGAQYPEFNKFRDKPSIFLYDGSYLWSLQGIGARFAYLNQWGANVQALGSGVGNRSILIDFPFMPGVPIAVTTSKPNAFAEDIGPTTPVTTETEEFLHRLVWSKTQEPDAWPIPYFVDIGSASARILRILPTRESLFVFKEDGTWRVSGFSPESLRVDEYDRTLKLMHPNALSQVDNHLVGWFLSGVAVVTDATTENISDHRIGEELAAIRNIPARSPFVSNVWAFTAERSNQWYLITGTNATTHGPGLYVHNFMTQAWVRWQIENSALLSCGIDLERRAQIAFGGQHNVTPTSLLWLETQMARVDGPANTLTSVVSTSLGPYRGSTNYELYEVFFSFVGVGPKPGDILIHGGAFLFVVDVVGSGLLHAVAQTYSSVATTADHYYAHDVVIEWTAKTAQNSGKRKFWREANYAFEHFGGLPIATLGFAGDVTAGQFLVAHMPEDRISVAESTPYFLRALISRNAGRQVWLNPSIRLTGALGGWRLEACNLVYNWMEVRT